MSRKALVRALVKNPLDGFAYRLFDRFVGDVAPAMAAKIINNLDLSNQKASAEIELIRAQTEHVKAQTARLSLRPAAQPAETGT